MPLTQVSSRLIEDTLRYVLGASGTDHYTFTGKGLTGAVNDPTLTLSRGHTYVFENRNSSGAHPFYIKTSIANGGTNDAYNTGVTNNGGAGGTEIVFTVPHDAPDVLYYQCSSHSSMSGQLNIAGSVADGSITESKLADDAVTADKLANSINTAIAANTAKDLTALSASNLTSGTVPDARFPATLPAASAANLTSIPAANITGTLPAISGANLTGITTGITELDMWVMATNHSADSGSTLNNNLNRLNTSNVSGASAQIGTGMSKDTSTGIFTFPSTGKWLLHMTVQMYLQGDDNAGVAAVVSTDGGTSYATHALAYTGGNAGNTAQSASVFCFIDVTNTSNVKLKFQPNSLGTDSYIAGASNYIRTSFTFIRIGGT